MWRAGNRLQVLRNFMLAIAGVIFLVLSIVPGFLDLMQDLVGLSQKTSRVLAWALGSCLIVGFVLCKYWGSIAHRVCPSTWYTSWKTLQRVLTRRALRQQADRQQGPPHWFPVQDPFCSLRAYEKIFSAWSDRISANGLGDHRAVVWGWLSDAYMKEEAHDIAPTTATADSQAAAEIVTNVGNYVDMILTSAYALSTLSVQVRMWIVTTQLPRDWPLPNNNPHPVSLNSDPRTKRELQRYVNHFADLKQVAEIDFRRFILVTDAKASSSSSGATDIKTSDDLKSDMRNGALWTEYCQRLHGTGHAWENEAYYLTVDDRWPRELLDVTLLSVNRSGAFPLQWVFAVCMQIGHPAILLSIWDEDSLDKKFPTNRYQEAQQTPRRFEKLLTDNGRPLTGIDVSSSTPSAHPASSWLPENTP